MEKLFETLEDHELWTLLAGRDWRLRLAALPKPQGERLRTLLERAMEPLAPPVSVPKAKPVIEDHCVNIKEAARLIGVSHSWLYKNAKTLPFTRRPVIRQTKIRRLLFSANAIQEWLDSHRT